MTPRVGIVVQGCGHIGEVVEMLFKNLIKIFIMIFINKNKRVEEYTVLMKIYVLG